MKLPMLTTTHTTDAETHAMRRRTRPSLAGLAAALLALPAAVWAQEQPQKPEQPPAPAPSPAPANEPATPPAGEPLPGLDELLGIERGRAGELEDPSRGDLERRLTGQQVTEAFRQAVQLMGDAADRLGRADPDRAGIGTQRVQQDAANKLDELISKLEQMAQRQRSRSSSSSQQQQQQANQRQPNQQRAEQQAERNEQGENNSEAEPPGRRDGPLRPELDSARASWGALPARVRDMLLQGSSDRFSSMYEKMTESYYRRLAEERRGQ